MKILEVVSVGYVCGGAEKSVLVLKEGLKQQGHDVRVLSSDIGPANESFADYTFPAIGTSFLSTFIGHLWHYPAYRALKNCIISFKPDVVHFHTMGQLSPAALFAIKHIPAIMTVHGPEEYTPSLVSWTSPAYFYIDTSGRQHLTIKGRLAIAYYKYLQLPIYLKGLHYIDRLIAPTKFIAKQASRDNLGVPITHIYNGMNLPAYQPMTIGQNILFIGRLETVKGVRYAIESIRLLAEKYPNIALSIVGDGNDREFLEKHVNQLGLNDRVTFLGWLSENAIVAQLTKANVLVIPSVWPENQPTVCIEALATGRPVVGTPTGGLPEMIINNETGYLVEPANINQLAEGISYFLDQSDLVKVGQACVTSSKKYELQPFLNSIEDIMAEVIKLSRP